MDYPREILVDTPLTPEDIALGIPTRCEQCPLARLVQREVTKALNVPPEAIGFVRASVTDLVSVYVFDSETLLATYQGRASRTMGDFMEAFDQGQAVQPIRVFTRLTRLAIEKTPG